MKTTVRVPVDYQFDPRPLREAIRNQKLKQEDIAAELRCHPVHLSRVLNGSPASVSLIRALCARLDVPENSVLALAA